MKENDPFDCSPDEEIFLEDLFDEEAMFIAELDEMLCHHFAGTKWEAPMTKLSEDTPWEERIALFQELQNEKALPENATYFLIAWAIESYAEEQIDALYESTYAQRFEKIRGAHGLKEDEEWEPGTGPAEYEELDKEFSAAADVIARTAYQHFCEDSILELIENDPDTATAKYEEGQKYINDKIDEDDLSLSEEGKYPEDE